MTSFRIPFSALAVALAALTFFGRSAGAQESPGELPPLKPIAILNLNSLDGGLGDLATMFEVAGRADMTDVLQDLLDERAGNLRGIDRTRPLGVMLFLEETLPPQPRPIAYLPYDNESEFLRTLSLGRGEVKKTGEHEYELTRRRNTMKMRLVDNYALLSVRDPDGTFLDRGIPNPAAATAGLSSRFDVALSLQIRNIPPLLRQVFVGMFKSKAEAELQQRDNEPDAVYKIRKANGNSVMTLLQQILSDGEQITLGLDTAKDGSRSVFELHVDALPETDFSKFLKNVAGKPTFFEPLLTEQTPLTMSISWNLDQREQTAATGWVDAFQTGMKRALSETTHPSIERMAASLQATVDQAHADAIFQFVPHTNREFVLLGGLRMTGAASFASGLETVIAALQEKEFIDTVELNAHEHQTAVLHRLKAKAASSDDMRIYGAHPSIYLGVGGSVFWFALGGEGALNRLDSAIDATMAATPASRTGSAAPFQIVFRALPWLQLPEREGQPPIVREIANEAFDRASDAVRIEFRPSDTGGRLRLQFDGSFVRLAGLIVSQLYDRSQL